MNRLIRSLAPSIVAVTVGFPLVSCEAQSGAASAAQQPGRARDEVREQLGPVDFNDNPEVARALSNTFRSAANRVLPAVVQVAAEREARRADMPQQLPDFFRFFGIPDDQMQIPPQSGMGTGFIIDTAGRIITNNHVVAGADRVRVRLADGREFTASVTGRDESTDIAIVRIRTGGGGALPHGDVRDLGQPARR